MSQCECLPRCIFYNDHMANMPKIAEMMKMRYCKNDNSKCARYMVFQALGRERVPADLFPDDLHRAEAIVAAG